LEYDDLPPMTPGGALFDESGAPDLSAVSPERAAPVNDDAPEPDESLDAPDDMDDAPDDETDQEQPTDDDDVDPNDEVAQLRKKLQDAEARAEQASQYEAQWAEYQRVQQQQAAEAYWHNAQSQAENWFQQRESAIYKEAEDAIAPVAYVQQQMGMLNQQRVQWFQQFHAQREQSLWQFAMQQALPNYAAEVADHYHLPRERVAELLTYPPDLIPREAERMARERDEAARKDRKRRQEAAKKKKAELSANSTFPGGGQGGTQDFELGSEDHYHSIAWERIAPGGVRR
jgi:hypothetical protein